ncbi:MAG: class I SAM-dependent methyltransferase [Desulfobacterales bacterium]
MNKQHNDYGKKTLKLILHLSWRISDYAPPMKPFIRFSKQTDTLYKEKSNNYKHFFWDFDDALQKVLLGMALSIATPAEIAEACIERWKINLEKLYQRSKGQLEELRKNGKAPQFQYTPRDKFIFSRVEPGSSLLYAGCGAGTECLGWAQRGYEVVGIDTDEQLVGIANEWAEYLKLPFRAICMDVDKIVFPPGSFDGFLLEFYGFQPSLVQALAVQRGLANSVNDNGKGFIVATRKKYASFWYRMSNHGYPESMFHWLAIQYRLDHCFSQIDACEEKLAFGLYVRSHTVDSLARELSGVFDVQECMYEENDPRYLISVVKRKIRFSDSPLTSENDDGDDWTKQEYLQIQRVSIEDILSDICAICDLLELHKKKVEQFFLNGEVTGGKSPLSMVDTNLPRFIELLEHTYGMSHSAYRGNSED